MKRLTKAGELLPGILPTRQQQKLIEASAEIRQSPEAAELSYLARPLLLATLPHSDPGKAPVHRRTENGNTLLLQSGYAETGELIGLPYGIIPRLLLFWVVTEAVRTKKPKLHLGNRLTDFMRDLGLDPSRGGKRSDAYRLREQAHRLFSSSVQLFSTPRLQSYSPQDGDLILKNNEGLKPIAKKSALWWNPREPHAPVLFGSWVELSQEFYEAIVSAPVPLDIRALKALRYSPLALDLYALVSYQSFVASLKGKEYRCTWSDLHQQLGADYADLKNFGRKCVAALRKIEDQMPGLKWRQEHGGFAVLPSSRPAIKPR
jgi:hypothetical protein